MWNRKDKTTTTKVIIPRFMDHNPITPGHKSVNGEKI